jgi:hypothetical protein
MKVVFAVATENVVLSTGATVRVPRGSMVPESDPLVRARPDLFSSDPRHAPNLLGTELPAEFGDDTPVETASAAPGERRNTRRTS